MRNYLSMSNCFVQEKVACKVAEQNRIDFILKAVVMESK